MENHDPIFEQVIDVLVDSFDLPRDKIRRESRLYEELDLDSLDAIDLAVQLKQLTGIRLREEDLQHIRTVEDVIQIIVSSREKNPTGAPQAQSED